VPTPARSPPPPVRSSTTTPLYVQATGFILDLNGNVITSVYRSGAIGRLLPDDVLGLVK
jgi:hypothetical protein